MGRKCFGRTLIVTNVVLVLFELDSITLVLAYLLIKVKPPLVGTRWQHAVVFVEVVPIHAFHTKISLSALGTLAFASCTLLGAWVSEESGRTTVHAHFVF